LQKATAPYLVLPYKIPRKLAPLVIALCLYCPALAQEYPKTDIDLQAFTRNIIGIPTENLNYDELLENLAQLYYQPLNLNHANRQQLANLYLLTDKQISSFLAYRQQAGALLSVYELQAVPGFSLDTIHNILPFVTVPAPSLSANNLAQSYNMASKYLIVRYAGVLEQKKGFSPLQGRQTVRYLGSPGNVYLRYKAYHSNDISAGITLEKDDGESIAWQPKLKKYGADYLSAHVTIQNKGHWKSINLGDYQLQYGQGLVLAAGFYLGKGSETILATRRNSLGIKPYSSLGEQGFFRGAAATYKLGTAEITAFASSKWRTANQAADSSLNLRWVTSVDADGLHRTHSELADKNSLKETNTGGNITWQNHSQNLKIEATTLFTSYTLPIIKANKAYNKYEFTGRHNHVYSLSHTYNWRNINLFGELARSRSQGIAMVQGAIISLGKSTDLSLVYRSYSRHFHSIYANAFGENTRNINEKGLYLGYKYNPNRRWIYSSSLDVFSFPNIKFGVDAPSHGVELLQRLSYKPTKTTEYYLQYRQQRKQYNAQKQTVRQLSTHTRQNLALHYERSHGTLGHSSSLQASSYREQGQPASYGLAIIQNASYKLKKLNIAARLAYFKTANYDNRLYAYEQDLLYAFSFPAYSGHGLRHYMLLTAQAHKQLRLQVRWARTRQFAASSIGTGLEQIPKAHKTDLKIQAIWEF
jgi:hypothetical protein